MAKRFAPARPSMKDAIAKLRAIPKAPSDEALEPIEMSDRGWD